MTRFVLEGEWTGYTACQQRIVHREIVTEQRAARLRKVARIVYTDGTSLLLSVRPAVSRERVEELRPYVDLIRTAERAGEATFIVRPSSDLVPA